MATSQSGDDDRSGWFIRVTSPFLALSTLAILLRFWSRSLGEKPYRFWWDDWTALISWAEGSALIIAGLIWTQHGLGRHAADLTASEQQFGLRIQWASYLINTTNVSLVKISALLFYARVFSGVRLFTRTLLACHALVISWLVTFSLLNIFSCSPVQKSWNPEIPGKCLDIYAWLIPCGVLNVVLDILILLLPMPMVWSLQVGRARKLSIAGAFVCGYLAVIPSVGRLVIAGETGRSVMDDPTYKNIPELNWSYVEAPIAVVSLCIPSCFQLYKRAMMYGFPSLFSHKDPKSTSRSTAVHARENFEMTGFKKFEKTDSSEDEVDSSAGGFELHPIGHDDTVDHEALISDKRKPHFVEVRR